MTHKYITFLSIFVLFFTASAAVAQVTEETFQEALSSGPPQQIVEETPFCCQKRHFWIAGGELIALQLLPNYFNWHVSDDTTAVLSWDSWDRNVREGFEWDPNSLTTNMFAHPYHGAMFFNAGRANGYSFWESMPWAFAGSFIWEFFGENNRGAINDWAMTSLGGITIGEGLHRTAAMLRDNQARGVGRAFRELGGFLIDPVGGFTRAARGEMSKIGPNPPEKYPASLHVLAHLGARQVWSVEEGRRNEDGTFGYFDFDLRYGDPMHDYKKPFDAFKLAFQYNGKKEKSGIGLLQVHGTIYGKQLKQTDKVRHSFTMDMLFDYANNQAFEFGGQAFGFGVHSRWKLPREKAIQTLVQPSLIVMGAVDSEPSTLVFEDRNYDFGSGLGLRLIGNYVVKGYNYATLGYRGFFQHSVNGAKGNQVVQFVFLSLHYPIWKTLGIGAQYLVYTRDSWFSEFEKEVHARNPEFRLNATFFW
jgi:hypothetical protein